MLEFEKIEKKDIDVYTCIARDSQNNASFAFDNDFNVRILYDVTAPPKRPEIIEIYKYGEQKYNHEYSLKCISGFCSFDFMEC